MADETTYVSIFDDYPVKITPEELKNERNIDIQKEYPEEYVQRSFMSDVHSSIYEGAIYATGDKDIKDRIIKAYIKKEAEAAEPTKKTENAIKRALILQAAYMHDEGNAGTTSGVTITADGQRAVIGKTDLRSKNICIAALDALKACSCPLLYAGEDL